MFSKVPERNRSIFTLVAISIFLNVLVSNLDNEILAKNTYDHNITNETQNRFREIYKNGKFKTSQ